MNVIYVGSFDPFHYGHCEIVKYVLYNYENSIVHILPNAPSKKFRQSVEHRCNIIQCYFDKTYDGRITISEMDVDAYMLRLCTLGISNVIGIMGSDCYNKHIKSNILPKLCVKQWLIVVINNVECIQDKHNLLNAEILPSGTFRYQHLSSTTVKVALRSNKNIGLSDDAYEYTKLFNLYNLHVTYKVEWITKNVCVINDEFIVKFFFNSASKFTNEVLGREYLNLPYSSIVDTYENNVMCYVKMTYIYDVASVLQMCKNKITDTTYDSSNFYNIGKNIGLTLKKLHDDTSRQILESEMHNVKLNKIFPLGIPSNLIVCNVHGDASIRNVCVNKDCNIYFIDFEKYHTCGIAYYEYMQFISSIYFYNSNDKQNLMLHDGFVDGYGPVTHVPEVDEYWKKKSINI
jgi:cytidyltransferase-like protein